MQKNLIRSLFSTLIHSETEEENRAKLSAAETDNTFLVGARQYGETNRDRFTADREDTLAQALDAWRLNPLARRIVGLTSQYVVGGGISIECKHNTSAKFIEDFWHNRLNRMPVRVYEWCDELTRSGDLFILVSTDPAGMSYVRAIPAADIDELQTAANDVEQLISVVTKADPLTLQVSTWPAYNEKEDGPDPAGNFEPVILHYAINRPVGGAWGESDLAPLLKWLSRYSAWLDDRARLNRFRNAFLYQVKSKFASEAERLTRQNTLAANPPTPGSILVTDESEEWSVIAPELNSADAATDGLALKKMIASGAGVPLHFLAEPESSTRTTAEAAGGPTYRHFEQRQNYFCWLLADVIRVVLSRRSLVDRHVSKTSKFEVRGGDISARDNASLSVAASNIANVFEVLHDKGLIDGNELLRLVYRFSGENIDEDQLNKPLTERRPAATVTAQPGNVAKSEPKTPPAATQPIGGQNLDPETGEPKTG
jgi:hypothetical protein